MRFALNDDQAMIAETVTRMFAASFDHEALMKFARDGVLRDEWRGAIGGSGLLGVCAAVEVGGLGLGAVDALAIARAAGAHAVPFPVAEGIVAAAMLGSRPDVARAVIGARAIATIAGAGATVTAVRGDDGIRLSGRIPALAWAAQSDVLITDLVFADGAAGRCLVQLNAPGVRIEARRSIDLTAPAATIVLEAAAADLLGNPAPAPARLRTVLATAEMEGAAATCLALAVGYMKDRRQFGQEIGRFQALKHIAATDALAIESMSVATAYAAWAHDSGADDAEEALHVAKSYASNAARMVAEDAIQCHGGIGFTWDYGLHLYLRRILRLGALHGTAHEHRGALIAALIAQEEIA